MAASSASENGVNEDGEGPGFTFTNMLTHLVVRQCALHLDGAPTLSGAVTAALMQQPWPRLWITLPMVWKVVLCSPWNVTLTSSDSGFAFSNGGLVIIQPSVQVIGAVSPYLIATASARYCLYRRRPRLK